MKKKYLIMPLLSISLLTACNVANTSSSPATDFNSAVEYNYSYFKITIETSKDELKLTSVYDVSKNGEAYTTNYSIQNYNTFDLSSDTLPESIITTETGTYTKNDIQYNIAGFKYDDNTFDKYSFEEGKLTGEISNAKKYLNATFDCLNFKIVFTYSTTLIEIKMNYSLADNTAVSVVINNFK